MPLSQRTKYLLDTNIVSFAVNADWNKPDNYPHWISRRIRANVARCYLPVVATQELLYGVHYKSLGERRKAKVDKWIMKFEQLSYDTEAAKIAAELKAELARSGTRIEDADLQIAAIALRDGLILVTDNVKHFGRIPKLKIENWRDMPMSVEEFFRTFIYDVLHPLNSVAAVIIAFLSFWLTFQINRTMTTLDWWLQFTLTVVIMAVVLGIVVGVFQRALVSLFLVLQRKCLI